MLQRQLPPRYAVRYEDTVLSKPAKLQVPSGLDVPAGAAGTAAPAAAPEADREAAVVVQTRGAENPEGVA